MWISASPSAGVQLLLMLRQWHLSSPLNRDIAGHEAPGQLQKKKGTTFASPERSCCFTRDEKSCGSLGKCILLPGVLSCSTTQVKTCLIFCLSTPDLNLPSKRLEGSGAQPVACSQGSFKRQKKQVSSHLQVKNHSMFRSVEKEC